MSYPSLTPNSIHPARSRQGFEPRADGRTVSWLGTSAGEPTAQLFLHPCLQTLMFNHSKEFARLGLSIMVVDDVLERLASDHQAAVALPATNADRLDLISHIAHDFPLTAVLAAVIDPTGLISSRAIDAGASWVLNVLIPPDLTVPTIAQQLLTHLDYSTDDGAIGVQRQSTKTSPVVGRPMAARTPCNLTVILPAADQDHELLHLLMDGESTTDLAKRFYCSERSMYRRLRHIYDRVGVSGRYELMNRLGAQIGRSAV